MLHVCVECLNYLTRLLIDICKITKDIKLSMIAVLRPENIKILLHVVDRPKLSTEHQYETLRSHVFVEEREEEREER